MSKLDWDTGFAWKGVSTQAGYYSVYQHINGTISTTRNGVNVKGHEKVTTLDEGCALCEAHFESVVNYLATSNGYVKLEPGECVVRYEKWLPYLKKAYNAARLMEKHDAFTVKWYHNDWPSVEMLDELTAAIEGAVNDDKGA
jgi:hypothetical protein